MDRPEALRLIVSLSPQNSPRCHVQAAVQSAIKRKRLPDDLIHIVIAITSETAQKNHVRLLPSQFSITLVKQLVLRPRDRIEWIALAAREFIADRGHPVHLAGEV